MHMCTLSVELDGALFQHIWDAITCEPLNTKTNNTLGRKQSAVTAQLICTFGFAYAVYLSSDASARVI